MGKVSLADVLQLSVSERIQLVEDIWDTLQDVPEPLQLTAEQREELKRRLEDHRQYPDDGISWDELKKLDPGREIMLPKIVFKSGAKAEIKDAFNWYEEREAGLGFDFIRSVDACLQLIRRHPKIFPVIEGNIRYAVIRRFPYQVFYLPENKSIFVLSVFHASRKPKRWMRS